MTAAAVAGSSRAAIAGSSSAAIAGGSTSSSCVLCTVWCGVWCDVWVGPQHSVITVCLQLLQQLGLAAATLLGAVLVAAACSQESGCSCAVLPCCLVQEVHIGFDSRTAGACSQHAQGSSASSAAASSCRCCLCGTRQRTRFCVWRADVLRVGMGWGACRFLSLADAACCSSNKLSV